MLRPSQLHQPRTNNQSQAQLSTPQWSHPIREHPAPAHLISGDSRAVMPLRLRPRPLSPLGVWWLALVTVVAVLGSGRGVLSGETWGMVSICPFHCVCRNLSESLSTLCVNKGLLFVPPNIDRRTVELRLADNYILEVGGADFANMTGLVDLTLSRNTIHALRPMAFADLESLRSLHLDTNRLTRVGGQDLTGLLNLQHLIISNNQLTHVAPDAFDDFLLTLEDLDLSYNNLRRVPWEAVRSMASLSTLNLDHNLIDQVAEGSFGELYKLSRLDMTSNRLRTLPPEPLFSRSQLGAVNPTPYNPFISLSFGGNPLHCNCQLLWLRRLVRQDDMETCATPPHLAGRYFWSVPEEEFTCEPPLVTRSSGPLWALEGQRASLRCRAIGDPEPVVHWLAPDGRIVANSSRVRSYRNGTLDFLVTRSRDDGVYTCIAANAAGEATAQAELRIVPLPHRGNSSERDPAPSDISSGRGGGGAVVSAGRGERAEDATVAGSSGERLVGVVGVTSTSAEVRWQMGGTSSPYLVWMYQIQYNSTADDALVYRILPPTSESFLLRHLVSGADYSLCVLAIFDDGLSALSTTRVLGCIRFSTKEDYPECRTLQAHFLGGTLTVLVGGVLVVTLLVFTVAMMVRHRVCGGCRDDGHGGATGEFLPGKGVAVYAQTSGSDSVMMVALPSRALTPPNKVQPTKTKQRNTYAQAKPEPAPEPATSLDRRRNQRTAHRHQTAFTPDAERRYTSHTLPRPSAHTSNGGSGQEQGRSQSGRCEWEGEDEEDEGGARRLGTAPQLLAKRSNSFDMGEITTATCYGYAKRLSVIWGRRSQSLHGMLVHYASATGRAGEQRGHLHTHNNNNNNKKNNIIVSESEPRCGCRMADSSRVPEEQAALGLKMTNTRI